jgi:hypothetical protein
MRDVMARVTRALEAIRDGDAGLGDQILEDLSADVWKAIESEESLLRRADAARRLVAAKEIEPEDALAVVVAPSAELQRLERGGT